MKFQIATTSLLFFILTSCNPSSNPTTLGQHLKNQKQTEMINEVPANFEQPDIDDTEMTTEPTEPIEPTTPPPITQKPAARPEAQKEASKFIQIAYQVMVKEGQSLKTACNHYLQRVLQRAGFPKGEFIANDFDIYAKTQFKSYKSEDFKIDSNRSDKEDLKKYLWSYNERTPFILQWTRPGYYGHVAILERIGDHLIIYQASINIHTARKEQTTIEKLLSSRRRAHLTVYSEFR